MRKHLSLIIAILFTATVAAAGAIKVWASGESLSSATLNANFAHIHNLMVGGHGARLVDADVSSSAAISQSKIAGGTGIPRAWAVFTTLCGVGVCTETIQAGTGVSSIEHTAVGAWTITWSVARTDLFYATFFQTNTASVICYGSTKGTSTQLVNCRNDAGAATDGVWQLMMLDN